MTYERKVTVEQELEIVKKYEVGLISCIALAAEYGMTRQGIHKILRKNGVDTRRMGANCRPTVKCHHCGVMFQVNRARVRGNDGNFYHSKECWIAHLQSIKIGKLSRSGLMRARQVLDDAGICEHWATGSVVHHVDGNDFNNDIRNLEIYATQGDHLRKHRGFDVKPVWSGKQHAKAHPECLRKLVDDKVRLASVAELTKKGIVDDFTKYYMKLSTVAKKYEVDVSLARLVLHEAEVSCCGGGKKVSCPICGKEHKFSRSAKPQEWAMCCSKDCIDLYMTNKQNTEKSITENLTL